MNNLQESKIAIIGLGYVGLPLAVEFSKKFPVIGFDISKNRVDDLKKGNDQTLEVEGSILLNSLKENQDDFTVGNGLFLSSEEEQLKNANIYIVTVPTPIDKYKKPDLGPLLKASEMIGKYLVKDDIVIYESTTYPGCTEEDCVPVLERFSSLGFNKDFYVGYSPERINPGDKVNTLTTIQKVTSGSTEETATLVDELYKTIITAGTHKAKNIKVAEASKAIENAQRDVNISFVNELAIIFDHLNVDTNAALEAAGTKWNFLKFKPGLVGGHCIGVDPYYLAHKAELAGYQPNVILSGRRVNDQMGSFIANKVIKMMIAKGVAIKDSKVLVLGFTFKENCPDTRNTRVIDIQQELTEFGCEVTVYDPWADKEEVKREYKVDIEKNLDKINENKYDCIVLAVSHKEFYTMDLLKLKSEKGIIYDCKGCLDESIVDARL